jgi:hypothetical protein
MAESILVKILNSKPITLASSCSKRRKQVESTAPLCNDIIVENLNYKNLTATTIVNKKMKCHRDSLESNNCDEGDDSGTEPWSGSCSSDSLSEHSECHNDQNDSGCEEFIFHELDEHCNNEFELEDEQELLEIAAGNDTKLCDVSRFEEFLRNFYDSNGLQTKEKNICTLKVH